MVSPATSLSGPGLKMRFDEANAAAVTTRAVRRLARIPEPVRQPRGRFILRVLPYR
jgi:hypothetical protein